MVPPVSVAVTANANRGVDAEPPDGSTTDKGSSIEDVLHAISMTGKHCPDVGI